MQNIRLINSTTPTFNQPVNNNQGSIGVMYDEESGNA